MKIHLLIQENHADKGKHFNSSCEPENEVMVTEIYSVLWLLQLMIPF